MENNVAQSFVEMKHITKIFPGVKALDDVDFSLAKGEVHALLGENGAGKSTLMKILAGMYGATAGSIFIEGKQVEIRSPQTAIAHKIGMVYQNFTLSPELTVLENIVLGSPVPFYLNKAVLTQKVQKILDEYGMEVDLNAKIWQLSVGQQQRVEILKCFYHQAKILILDEPTAVLTPLEIEELFVMIRRVVASGCSVVFISHKLGEVLEIADRITVFRKGKKVDELDAKSATPQTLSRAMVGREVDLNKQYSTPTPGPSVLRVQEVFAKNDKGLPALNGISLELREGEILGIAAISGNGQAELAEVLTALRKIDSGTIELADGQSINRWSIHRVIDAGIAHISEKRMNRSLIPSFSIAQNLIVKDYAAKPFCKRGILQKKVIAEHGEALLRKFDISAPSADTAVGTLSGGNAQKVVLAREITRDPKILLAVNPTYGLDIGAIEFVQQCLVEQREKGMAILLISEELDEVLRLSDRIAVMAKGEIQGVFQKSEYNREAIGMLMAQGRKQS